MLDIFSYPSWVCIDNNIDFPDKSKKLFCLTNCFEVGISVWLANGSARECSGNQSENSQYFTVISIDIDIKHTSPLTLSVWYFSSFKRFSNVRCLKILLLYLSHTVCAISHPYKRCCGGDVLGKIGERKRTRIPRGVLSRFFCLRATRSAVGVAARECWFRLPQTKLLLLLPSSIPKKRKILMKLT